jgi:asparagine synthase (glutamine-hydrolysing)
MSGFVGTVNCDNAACDFDATFDGPIALLADARIDGCRPGVNDHEAILQAFEKWGEDCVGHLIGDFAFALWDKRSRRLFCARDHFGVKPFFFAHTRDIFLFSNSLNLLRRDPRVSDALDETAVGDYLAFGLNQDLATTTFRDIQRLPPGHKLSLTNGSLTIRRYWTPEVKKEIRFRDEQAYVDGFNELFSVAVSDRLRAPRVSISMSGGLDSTSIAAVARELLPASRAVQAFSTVYDQLIPDQERHFSTLAASHIGMRIHHLSADKYSLFEGPLDLPEPFLISPLAGQFNDLLRMMAEHGSVALTGYDGDALMNEARPSVRQFLGRILRRKESRISYPEWIDDAFARRINLNERWQESTPARKRPSTIRALQSKVWSPLFEGYDPCVTGLTLEVRHPFIDLRLVEYLLSIPTQPWCTNKHILRRAMKHRLPEAVVNRPKTPLAGDPALHLSRRASVRWLDNFEVAPQLTQFIDLSRRPSLAKDETPDVTWANLRLFAFNHWLTHSYGDKHGTEPRSRSAR